MSSVRKSARVFPDLVPPDTERRAGPKLPAAVLAEIDLLPALGLALAFVVGAAATVLFLTIAA